VVPLLDSRNLRRARRARVGGAIEALEPRELLAYSALGFSLPIIALKGYSSPVASWGGGLNVTVDVYNRGASTLVEPLHLTQGSISTADLPASTIDVFASKRPGQPGVFVGTLSVPAIHQNDVSIVTGTLTLPSQPAGFPGNGGKIFLTFVDTVGLEPPNMGGKVATFVSHEAVTIHAPLPNLQVIGFETPSPLQPGDTLQPAIRIANIGTADTDTEGPLTVYLVASQDTNFGPGDTILATYNITNIPAATTASTTSSNVDNLNLVPGNNIVTINNMVITLPSSPKTFFLGVKVNPAGAPLGTILEAGNHSSPRFDAFVKVGPPIAGLAPVNFVGTTTPATTTQFPFPLGFVSGTGAATTVTTPPILFFNGVSVGAQQFAAISGSRHPRNPVTRPSTGPKSTSMTTISLGQTQQAGS
jgi:hypothetical protein